MDRGRRVHDEDRPEESAKGPLFLRQKPAPEGVEGAAGGFIGPHDVRTDVAGTCPHCGGANAADASVCQWCGADMPLPSVSYPPPLIFDHPAAPLPFEPEEVRDEGDPGSEDEGDSSGDGRPFWTASRAARLAAAMVCLAVVVATIAYTSSSSSTVSTTTPGNPGNGGGPVDVSLVQVNSPDDACGLAGAAAGPFSSPSYATHPISWWLPVNGASVPCRVASVLSDTPGFTVWANIPLNVTAVETPLWVTIGTPAAYVGVLTLTIL